LSGQVRGKLPQDRKHRFISGSGFLQSARNGFHSFFAIPFKHVFLRGEIVEEGSLANIGRFGDVFHRSLEIAARSEELEGSAEDAFAHFDAVAFAAVDAGPGGSAAFFRAKRL
jgi:hypothetical protein